MFPATIERAGSGLPSSNMDALPRWFGEKEQMTDSQFSPEDLAAIAARQKALLSAIVLYIFAVVAQIAVPAALASLAYLLAAAATIAAFVLVVALASRVYGVGLAIILAFFSLIPFIGLLILLMVNGKATSILRQNGIDVGLLGARDRVA